jgi:hypothetical protein
MYVVHNGRDEKCVQCFFGRPEGKNLCGRQRHKSENNINVEFRKIGLEGVDWSHLTLGRNKWRVFVNMVVDRRVSQKAGNFLTN